MPFIHAVSVGPEDIDHLGHCNNLVYVRWLQDAARAHSAACGLTRGDYLRRGEAFVIRRYTVEMHMDKVESVDVEQSILGRLLDYGDVTVRGTGAGFEPLQRIARPLELRNHITGI